MITRMYRPRWIQKLWANIFSYFWKPCPLCGKYFGGHEWGRWNHFSVPSDALGYSQGICFYCTEKRRIDPEFVTDAMRETAETYGIEGLIIRAGSDGSTRVYKNGQWYNLD